MIYSASRRTDMTAFFPEEVVRRVRRSRRLEGIVLWTKDVRNLVRHEGLARVIQSVPTLIQFTATGLAGSAWEPGAPPLAEQLADLRTLAGRLPRGAVLWRFDPVLPLPETAEPEARLAEITARFRRTHNLLESALGRLTEATVSFPDPYPDARARTRRAGLPWPVFSRTEKEHLIAALTAALSAPGPEGSGRLRLCCEPALLNLPGVAPARCVDGALFETLYGLPLGGLAKDRGQRAACGCAQSTDIGSYAMRCRHGCLYCYAHREPPPGIAPDGDGIYTGRGAKT